MSLLLEIVINNGLLFDSLGILGLCLLGLAAIRLMRRSQSWGGSMIAAGAISLLTARLFTILSPHFINDDLLFRIGPLGTSLTIGLPPLLLTFGLAGIVWGLWGHERWLQEEALKKI